MKRLHNWVSVSALAIDIKQFYTYLLQTNFANFINAYENITTTHVISHSL